MKSPAYDVNRLHPTRPTLNVNGVLHTRDAATVTFGDIIYTSGIDFDPSPHPLKAMASMCRKCARMGTQRHSRKCPKRGACHKGRENKARDIETNARKYGATIHVRRGRRGHGLSISVAEDAAFKARCLAVARRPTLYENLCSILGDDITIRPDPKTGVIAVTADIDVTDVDWSDVRDHIPIGIILIVNGVEI